MKLYLVLLVEDDSCDEHIIDIVDILTTHKEAQKVADLVMRGQHPGQDQFRDFDEVAIIEREIGDGTRIWARPILTTATPVDEPPKKSRRTSNGKL